LAERAELSLNVLTRATDATSDSVYSSFDLTLGVHATPGVVLGDAINN
jgi:hypothetical protein